MVKKQEDIKTEEIVLSKKETAKIKEEVISDLKDDLKTTIKEELPKLIEESYEDRLKPVLTEDINKEIRKRVEIEERRIIRSKNFTIFRKNIIIFLLLLTNIYLIYGWVSEYYHITINEDGIKIKEVIKDSNTTDDEVIKEEKEEEIIKDLAYYQKNYGYLIDNLKLNYLNNPMNYYLYNTNISGLDIRNDIKLNMVYSLINKDDIAIVEDKIMIPNEKMAEAFYQVFGNIPYVAENFIAECYRFTYNAESMVYEATNNICSNNDFVTLEAITEAYEEENTLVMTTVVGIYDKISLNLYNTDDLLNPVIGNAELNTFNIEDNIEMFNTYKYTFKLNENNEYIFENIEKIIK